VIVVPNKNYQRGFSAEKRCQEDLEAQGYWSQRSYGSKGAFDVIAVGLGRVRLIEVKRSAKPIRKITSIANKYAKSIAAVNTIPDGPASKELWVWIDKEGLSGEKNYRPAHWEKFYISKDSLSEIKGSLK
jgi:hypothetical protein